MIKNAVLNFLRFLLSKAQEILIFMTQMLVCNASVLFWPGAIAAILDVKSRGSLGRVQSATVLNGVGSGLTTNRDSGFHPPSENACTTGYLDVAPFYELIFNLNYINRDY